MSSVFSDNVVSWLKKKSQGAMEYDENGVPLMSERSVHFLCMQNNGYECEEINDKLYLHFQGFKQIGGLEKYTGLKCLYLESNGLTEVTNLNHLNELRCLYLQQNLIKSIARPAFEGLGQLVTLDISQNMLKSLDGLSCLVSLKTLNASKNYLSDGSSVKELENCPSIASLDLRGNQLEDAEGTVETLAKMPNITALYLSGNPLVKSIKNYRKDLINRFPKLTYLDERPVDEQDRIFANAWKTGGLEAEQAARDEWKEQEKDKTQKQISSWNEFKSQTRSKREAEIAQALAEGKPAPEPQKFVSYRTVSAEEEEKRQLRIRELAVAEARAEREALLGDGIQMMGIEFAKETAARNGAVFDGVQPPTAPPTQPTQEQETEPEEQETVLLTEEEKHRQEMIQQSMKMHIERKQKKDEGAQQQDQEPVAETVNPPPAPRVVEAVSEKKQEQKEEEAFLWTAELNEMLKTFVRESMFDFDKAAQQVFTATGKMVTGEACRLQFANLRKQQTTTTTKIAKTTKKKQVEEQQQEEQVVYGRPMPKVSIQAPVTLPSMEDFSPSSDSDDSPVVSPTMEDEDMDPSRDNNSRIPVSSSQRPEDAGAGEARNPLAKRLTRQDILETLHGSKDHPLAKELDEDDAALESLD